MGWCHQGRQLTVSPLFFPEKKLTTFLVIAVCKVIFSCRLFHLPTCLSSVLSKFSHIVYFIWVSPPGGCHPGRSPLLTPLTLVLRRGMFGSFLFLLQRYYTYTPSLLCFVVCSLGRVHTEDLGPLLLFMLIRGVYCLNFAPGGHHGHHQLGDITKFMFRYLLKNWIRQLIKCHPHH